MNVGHSIRVLVHSIVIKLLPWSKWQHLLKCILVYSVTVYSVTLQSHPALGVSKCLESLFKLCEFSMDSTATLSKQ